MPYSLDLATLTSAPVMHSGPARSLQTLTLGMGRDGVVVTRCSGAVAGQHRSTTPTVTARHSALATVAMDLCAESPGIVLGPTLMGVGDPQQSRAPGGTVRSGECCRWAISPSNTSHRGLARMLGSLWVLSSHRWSRRWRRGGILGQGAKFAFEG